MIIGDRAVAVFLVQARVTMDGRGGEIPGAIKGHQIMAVEKHHGFKRLTPLELSKGELERRSQGLRRHWIEALTHPRVTGRAFNTIDGLQIAFCPLFVKGEQGGCFERICAAAHIRSYAEFRNMWSILPRDGSNSFKVNRLQRSIWLNYSAYSCRPFASYIEGGQHAHDLLHTGADADDVCRCSCRAVSR